MLDGVSCGFFLRNLFEKILEKDFGSKRFWLGEKCAGLASAR
jgi:hypothetical protein